MSMNCLHCNSTKSNLSDSEKEYDISTNPTRKRSFAKIERIWSGTIPPPPYGYEKMRSGFANPVQKKVKTGHLRDISEGSVAFEGSREPRLVRSSGMRRDWSLEDLRKAEDKKGRKS
ncbi:hypothetical protein F2P56_020195 [Juglans regia]|uniref:Uncharacterized protein n=2 Tax=Juglans regia TaxID=51240 RepID=A0A833X5T3_JUGRE|nr:uncharacterized protein LOC108984088 [Juglans regia]KAF5460316.1 hypothetical protein F2P56_020195 [Juglans regia]